MNDSNYSPSLVSALKIARGMALQDKHNTFGVSHLVMAMFAENTGLKEILSSMQKDVGYIMEWFDTHREMYRSKWYFHKKKWNLMKNCQRSWMNPNGLKLN